MQKIGRPSWRASIDSDATLLHRALFIRDSCKLSVPPDSANPPRLIGEIADHSKDLSVALRTDAGVEWLSWWHDVVRCEVREKTPPSPVSQGNAQERARSHHAARLALFDWPELSALQSTPALEQAARVSGDDALRFRNAAKLAVLEQLERREPPRPISADLHPIADSLVERLAVSPDRLNATIEVLGVAGDWSYQPFPGALLCSMSVAQDAEMIAPLIEATFVSGIEEP